MPPRRRAGRMSAQPSSVGAGRETAGPGPLAGVRVIELGMLLAGPYAGRLLGDMGAEVIKVEPPGQPDQLRDWGKARYQGRSLWWPVQSRNKKCCTLNLRTERGQELLLELVKHADALVENFRPGDARALEHRPRPSARGEPGARDRTRVGVRADRPLRLAGRVRVGGRGDGRDPAHQRLPGRGSARGSTSRSATPSPGCSPYRGSSRPSTGGTRSAGRGRSSTSR